MKRVLVQVDEGTHVAWKARAFAEGRSMSDLARGLIEAAVLVERRVVPSAVHDVGVVRPRPHMKKGRPAVECPTRWPSGTCPDCGQTVP